MTFSLRSVLYAVLGLSLINPIPGYATGVRPTFPPVAAAVVSVDVIPVKARHHPKRRPHRLPFRAEPAPGDVNLGPVRNSRYGHARPGSSDRLVGRVPSGGHKSVPPRNDAASQAFLGLMLGAALGALGGVNAPSGTYQGRGGYGGGNRGNGLGGGQKCSVDYTTPNPTHLYCH